MKKLIVCLVLMLMCSSAFASDCDVVEWAYCEQSQLAWISEWFDYCYDINEVGEVYLCEISALDVMADYYMCWLD